MGSETLSGEKEKKGKNKNLDPAAPAFKPRSGLLTAPRSQQESGAIQQQQQPCGAGSAEHASRALRIIGIPPHVSCAGQELHAELSAWGPVRALQVEPGGETATVYYFDLRSAMAALQDIQRQHLAHQCRVRARLWHIAGDHGKTNGDCNDNNNNGVGLIGGTAVWAQYTIAVGLNTPDRLNQGCLVLFNVDASIPNALIRDLFQKYGSVKEVRDGPSNRQHKFVEFFDCRDAALALQAVDGQEIAGRRVKLEFSRRSTTFLRKKSSPPLSPSSSPMSMNCHWQGLAPYGPNYLSDNRPLLAPLPAGPSFGLRISMSICSPPLQDGGDGQLGHFMPSTSSNSSPLSHHSYTDCRVAMVDGPRQRRGARNDVAYNSDSPIEMGNGLVRSNTGGAAASKDQMDEYMFSEVEAESGDGRTTLMVRNIPNKYSQEKLLALLDEHCAQINSEIESSCDMFSAYDFVYLPMDFKNRCNLGYAFVNFTTPQATTKFHKVFDGREWGEFHSRKICKVTYARVQGRTSLEDHFRNSRFACDTDEFLPRVFAPPRTGLEKGGNGSNSFDDGDIDVCESGSSGRGWTGIGIVLGRRLSGHLKGGLPQGQRCGRVM